MTASAFAASNFSDVPSNHWATSYINKMSEGGLIKGYGNGKYGPEDKLTIGQMAKLICSAKGYAGKSANNTKYWAYGVVDYCINDLQCLPNLGAITPQNYDKNCSRELAFYMLEKGLGGYPGLCKHHFRSHIRTIRMRHFITRFVPTFISVINVSFLPIMEALLTILRHGNLRSGKFIFLKEKRQVFACRFSV